MILAREKLYHAHGKPLASSLPVILREIANEKRRFAASSDDVTVTISVMGSHCPSMSQVEKLFGESFRVLPNHSFLVEGEHGQAIEDDTQHTFSQFSSRTVKSRPITWHVHRCFQLAVVDGQVVGLQMHLRHFHGGKDG